MKSASSLEATRWTKVVVFTFSLTIYLLSESNWIASICSRGLIVFSAVADSPNNWSAFSNIDPYPTAQLLNSERV